MSEYCDTHGKHIPLTGGVCPECRIAELTARLSLMSDRYDEQVQWNADKMERIAELEELEDKVKNGYQGGCWCCEIVALKNIELEEQIEYVRNCRNRLKAQLKETDDE